VEDKKEIESPPGRCLLTRDKAIEHWKAGNIVIYPYNLLNHQTTSYDARLGKWYFREQRFRGSRAVLNPFSKADVEKYWGEAQQAVRAAEWMEENGKLEKIHPDDLIIVIGPGETILAHTFEFIGGRNCVSTEMRARSSIGRVGTTVCKCAGWGDLGYVNRWTMEMTNHLTELSIVLPVGMRIAQMIFYQVDPIEGLTYATEGGKYQSTDDVKEMIRSWKPEDMIPKLYKDRDIDHFREYIDVPLPE
jgi:dCTP deaminase